MQNLGGQVGGVGFCAGELGAESFQLTPTWVTHRLFISQSLDMGDVVGELVGMGFLQNRAEKAVFMTKRKGLQPALDWYAQQALICIILYEQDSRLH